MSCNIRGTACYTYTHGHGTVHTRFDRAAANAQGGSKTVHEGLEWHALADVRSDAWRRKHMHFPGQHRAAGAVRALDRAGARPSGATGGTGGAGGLNLGGAVAEEE